MKPKIYRFPAATELILNGKKLKLDSLNLLKIGDKTSIVPIFLFEDGTNLVMSAESLFTFMEKQEQKPQTGSQV